MELEQVKQDIESWIENFVEVPHPALGGWPPCPFARKARLSGTVSILLGTDPYFDLKTRSQWGMGKYEVVVYAYDPVLWTYPRFHTLLDSANKDFLLSKDLLVLEDHPDDVEIVNGICLNQGKYALALVQCLSDLNTKARQIASKGFYHGWPEEYLQGLFHHRQDPR